MPLIGNNVATYADVAKRLDANGKVDKIVELLMQWNEILDDMLVAECNNGTTHKTTVRTGIPQAAWRMLNYGVPRVKSNTAQVMDSCGMLEVYSEVDKALADMNGNTSAFRLSEASGVIEGMNQQMAQTLFYGNTNVNPERFLGLAPRYSTLSATVPSSQNIVDAGGTGSTNSSIWLVYWGELTCHGLYPKGSKAGLTHSDKGQQTVFDAAGGQYEAYRDHFKWDLGLTVRDWRYVVRIANVDVALLDTDTTYLRSLIRHMIAAVERINEPGVGRPAFYMNRRVRTALRNAILERTSNNLTYETVAGKRVVAFDGIPCRRVDALLNTEARIV